MKSHLLKMAKRIRTEYLIEEVKPDAEGWLKTTTFAQLNYLWNYSIDKDSKTVTLESFKGVDAKSNDIKVEIPREVEGYKVALENLNNEIFKGVTHIRVEKGEGQVKVLAKELVRGFENNENLKYVDLEGLDVSEVTDMTMLFSGCNNLRVIDIVGWDIQYDYYHYRYVLCSHISYRRRARDISYFR